MLESEIVSRIGCCTAWAGEWSGSPASSGLRATTCGATCGRLCCGETPHASAARDSRQRLSEVVVASGPMPKMFRVMRKGGDGRPLTGAGATRLGVRKGTDIDALPDGSVEPATGGMSVRPSLEAIPFHFVPKRLQLLVPGARGNNNDVVWTHGDGPFVAGRVGEELVLRPDAQDHGCVEPASQMPFEDYERAIIATQDDWTAAFED